MGDHVSEHVIKTDQRGAIVLEAQDIMKRYGHVTALRGANLEVARGEVVGIVGDNGAGKSTLVKILAGAVTPTSGRILIDNEVVFLEDPLAARSLGIETVYQDLALAGNIDVAGNVFLGREVHRKGLLGRIGWLDWVTMRRRTREELDRLGIKIESIRTKCENLSGGQRQAAAVARALAWGTRVIMLDEPTAALGVEEQRKVGHLVSEIQAAGIGVILVSHNLPQVHDLCDRIVVLFQGRTVANLSPRDTSIDDVVKWITGAALST